MQCPGPFSMEAGYDSGASLSVRAKQSARRRSKTYILLLLTNLLHRSSARHICENQLFIAVYMCQGLVICTGRNYVSSCIRH